MGRIMRIIARAGNGYVACNARPDHPSFQTSSRLGVGRMSQQSIVEYDAVSVGHTIKTGTVTVTAEMIDTFANVFGDRFEIHLDDAAAQARGYKRRVAHGILGLALTDGLKNQAEEVFDAVASLGWSWNFKGPIYAQDELQAEVTVLSKRRSASIGHGILELDCKTTNQRGEVVQAGTNMLMVR